MRPSMAGVEGRVALVTGAGSADGIGFATARLLRAKGAKVAITSTTDRIFERLEDLGDSQDETFAKTADLTDSAMVTGLCGAIEEKLGPIDILVNNAGMVQVGRDEPWAPFLETSDESWPKRDRQLHRAWMDPDFGQRREGPPGRFPYAGRAPRYTRGSRPSRRVPRERRGQLYYGPTHRSRRRQYHSGVQGCVIGGDHQCATH